VGSILKAKGNSIKKAAEAATFQLGEKRVGPDSSLLKWLFLIPPFFFSFVPVSSLMLVSN